MAHVFEPFFLEELLSSINQIYAPPPTSFPHLLSSISIPSAEDATTIEAAIQDSSRCERLIEKVLPRLKDAEKALKSRLDAHRQYQAQHRGMLSALRSLPPEVLSNIFLMCLPDSTYYTHFEQPPWSIS